LVNFLFFLQTLLIFLGPAIGDLNFEQFSGLILTLNSIFSVVYKPLNLIANAEEEEGVRALLRSVGSSITPKTDFSVAVVELSTKIAAVFESTGQLPPLLASIVEGYASSIHPPHLSTPSSIKNEEQYSLGFSDADYTLLRGAKKQRQLTQSDMVTVKESWNKLLAWKDMAMEAMFLRWVTLCGEYSFSNQLLLFITPLLKISSV